MKTTIPVFAGRLEYYAIPKKLVGKEVEIFLKAAELIWHAVTEAEGDKEILEITFSQKEMTEEIFDNILRLCKIADLEVKRVPETEGFVLAICLYE